MKVSDEMLARAADAMVMINNQASWVDLARAALEAVLADIPDPEEVRAEIMDGLAYGRSVETQALDARIAELEAKVARVRAWVEGHAQQFILADLQDILDGKEQP